MSAEAPRKKRRTLRDAEHELLDIRSAFADAKKKLLATARENAKMKVLLMKYLEKDESLICSSQLSNADATENEIRDDVGSGEVNEASESFSQTFKKDLLDSALGDEYNANDADTGMLSQFSQVSQWSEISSTSNLDEIINFLDKQEVADKERLISLESEYRDLHDAKTHVRVGVGVFLMSKKHPGCVLIGKRKGSHGEGKFALPGGHLEMYESWEECAIREVKEETDITLENVNFAFVTNDPMEDEGKHYITIFMQAVVPEEQVPINMEPHKCERWIWEQWETLTKRDNLFVPLSHITRSKFKPDFNQINTTLNNVFS